MARPLTDIDAGRDHLLNLVEQLIRERGAVSVTLSELASVAEMSAGNIYRFFDSKEALYEAIAERWFEPKIAIMEEVVASNVPVRQKLFDFFARRFSLMFSNFAADAVLFTSYCELGEEHFEIVRGYIDLGDHYLAMIVADAIEEGYFPGLSIDQSVSLINLMVQPFCDPKMMAMLGHSVTEEKLARIITAIFDGLGSDSKGLIEERDVKRTPELVS
jgi:TetR/AcrR family transcriptional regulator, repressor of the ameABC operon